ncbi:MAG TPA: TRAP transporter small permease subunit [Candidatus Methylomirabilis sp.]
MNAEGLVQRLENGVETVIRWVVVTILALICVNVFVQVILRYIFLYSSRWTLEVSRYMMIWAVLLAAGPALKRGYLVGIDMVVERLAPRTRISIACLLRVVMGVLAGTILVQALKLVQSQLEMGQMSPALEIPIAYMTMALPVGLGVFLFFLAVMLYNDVLRLRRE